MPARRKPSPRRDRKQLQAELERLTVPEKTGPVQNEPAEDKLRTVTQPEAEAERIRRMIEASYT